MSFRKMSFCFSFASGVMLWLSFPGGGEFWPLLFVALVPLLAVISRGSAKRAGLNGLVAGLVHFLLLLYWVVIVLGKYGGLHWFISTQALFFLALYMGIYIALFAVLARLTLLRLPVWATIWLLPTLWVGIDWLRGVLFTGIPWMDLGYALWDVDIALQIADLFGHHGVTWVVVFINTLIAVTISKRATLPEYLYRFSALAIVGISILTYSQNRIEELGQVLLADDLQKMRVGIVQGNVDQSVKWSPPQQKITVESYRALSTSLLGETPPALVVWPETALPFYPLASNHMQPLKKLVGDSGFALLTGAPWYEIIDRKARKVKFYNSAFLLEPSGKITGNYYKTHLVPFGEYVPFKDLLPFIAPLVESVGDFSPGVIEKPLAWKNSRIGVLICFESVFPELSRQWVLSGANILVNLTNDAWYGKSSAPYHSLAMAVFRAVETRRAVVRAANTGISAFIDPLGRVGQGSELFRQYAASASVALLEEQTFWVRYGYMFGPICFVLSLCVAVFASMRRERE